MDKKTVNYGQKDGIVNNSRKLFTINMTCCIMSIYKQMRQKDGRFNVDRFAVLMPTKRR